MNQIHQRLFISASVEEVYKAITTQVGLAGWWTSGAEAHPEIGSIARFPFGSNYFKEMKITELVPSKLVTWVCIAGTGEWIGTSISFQLEPYDRIASGAYPEMNGQLEQAKSNNGTILTFRHKDWKEQSAMFAECSYTWGQFLKSLKLLCETDKGKPWPYQHQ